MLDRLKKDFYNKSFLKKTRKVFDIDPGKFSFSSDNTLVILTMLQKKDVQLFLIAFNSFAQYLELNKVVVVCDSDMDAIAKSKISKVIKIVEFVSATDFRHEKIPTGGTWERLYAISHYVKDYYVIQMDGDTVTLSEPHDVINSVQSNQPFLLGTAEKTAHMTVEEMVELGNTWKKGWDNEGIKVHVQVMSEIKLMDSKALGFSKYSRGCSGFAGFSKGSITPEIVEETSGLFRELVGERWSEWGTEQFTSNLLLSNLDDLKVLPLDKYNSADRINDQSVFLHFPGFLRFVNTLYEKMALKTLG